MSLTIIRGSNDFENWLFGAILGNCSQCDKFREQPGDNLSADPDQYSTHGDH
jgi:hypothetical protein